MRLQGLAKYEWKKHGSCSGLGAARYMEESARLLRENPEVRALEQLLDKHKGAIVETKALATGPHVVVSSSPLCQIKEVTVCFARQDQGGVGEPVPCPAHLARGPRNSASRACSRLVVDEASRCQIVSAHLHELLKAEAKAEAKAKAKGKGKGSGKG